MSSIYTFWLDNPHYWISLGKNQAKADQEITQRFLDIFPEDDVLSQIIYLDQFTRHFNRYLGEEKYPEVKVQTSRKEASVIAQTYLEQTPIEQISPENLYFVLMPFKHLNQYQYVLDTVLKWFEENNQRPTLLQKFYEDTVKKYYQSLDYSVVVKRIYYDSGRHNYNPDEICEYWSLSFEYISGVSQIKTSIKITPIENPIVSLSGGVDSMVLLALYKTAGYEPRAVHIGYGNRPEAQQEFHMMLHFCSTLDVPLYYFPIDYLKRGINNRELYETITRNIRFSVYRALGTEQTPPNVILGHIRDDVVENIWTNFANDRHLDNLKKMESISLMDGVNIHRPLLETTKAEILDVAHTYGIPYTKNTTPTWSNRGKFRNHFYGATHAQYGPDVDKRLIRVAEKLQRQAEIVNRLIYDPILTSWDGFCFTLTNVEMLDDEEWTELIKRMFRTAYSTEPSRKACRNFIDRMRSSQNKNILMPMTKCFSIRYTTDRFYILVCSPAS